MLPTQGEPVWHVLIAANDFAYKPANQLEHASGLVVGTADASAVEGMGACQGRQGWASPQLLLSIFRAAGFAKQEEKVKKTKMSTPSALNPSHRPSLLLTTAANRCGCQSFQYNVCQRGCLP